MPDQVFPRSSAIEQHMDELEAGFQDLVRGLRATVKVLQDENTVLKGRLDELRRLHPPAPLAADAPKMRRCQGEHCTTEFAGGSKKRRFCSACYRQQSRERMTNLHQSGHMRRASEHVSLAGPGFPATASGLPGRPDSDAEPSRS